MDYLIVWHRLAKKSRKSCNALQTRIVRLIKPFVLRRFLVHANPDIFETQNFFFPDLQIFPSIRSVFKSNSPVHTHSMVSGFILEKLGLHVVHHIGLLFGILRDWTRLGFTVHTLSDSLWNFFFPLWRADSKLSGFAANQPHSCG